MLKELIARLKKQDVAEVAFKSGVSIATIHNITSGRNDNPTIKIVEKLQNFLDEKGA